MFVPPFIIPDYLVNDKDCLLNNEIFQNCVYGLFFAFMGLFAIIGVIDCIWAAQEQKKARNDAKHDPKIDKTE